MPHAYKMKFFSIIIGTFLISISLSFAGDPEPTICRSEPDEIEFKELAGPNIQVLAVCPKKGIYFVEIKADENQISQFKKNIEKSDLKIVKISTWKENTKIGSKVIMVEFNY